jgi:hypothetical protein
MQGHCSPVSSHFLYFLVHTNFHAGTSHKFFDGRYTQMLYKENITGTINLLLHKIIGLFLSCLSCHDSCHASVAIMVIPGTVSTQISCLLLPAALAGPVELGDLGHEATLSGMQHISASQYGMSLMLLWNGLLVKFRKFLYLPYSTWRVLLFWDVMPMY